MSTFHTFYTLTVDCDQQIRTAAADVAKLILAAEDQTAALLGLFDEYRGPFAAAKVEKAKEQGKQISRAWNSGRMAVTYHLKKEGFTPYFPDLRTGNGTCRLIANEQASEERKESAAAAKEQEQRDAAAFKAQQEQEQLAALRELNPDELTAEISKLIDANGCNPLSIVKRLMGRYGNPNSRANKLADIA